MKNVLVLDDDVRICEELAEFLNHRSYKVYIADKPSFARELLRKEKIDLVFLDINLPEISGIDYLKELKIEYPELEVIMITGIINHRLKEQAMSIGAREFMNKPISFFQIEKAISEIKKQ